MGKINSFMLHLGRRVPVWWATSLITFTSPRYKSRRNGLFTVLPDDVSKASKTYKRCKACIKLSYVTDNLVPTSPSSCVGLRKWSVTWCALRRVHWRSLTRDKETRKIGENYFFSAFRLVINKPNHCSLSLIVSFAVTVAIWLWEVVSYGNFILHSVTTFWVLSLVGIYPGRASFYYSVCTILCRCAVWTCLHHLSPFLLSLLAVSSPGRGWGGGGTQQMFIHVSGGSAPRSNPLPFYIPFFMKKVPLS